MEETICPEFMGALVTTDGRSARCTVHGATYRILFWRGINASPSGEGFGPDGAAPPEQTISISPHQILASAAAVGTAPLTPAAGTAKCYLHPGVSAPYRCRVCNQPICQVCDFAVPFTVEKPDSVLALGKSQQVAFHMCPRCAVAPGKKVSGSRKKLLVWSYILAAWSTLALMMLFVVALTVHDKTDLEAMGAIMGYLVLVPALIGTALGVAGFDRRLPTSISVIVAAMWNGSILGVFILLMIIGLMK